MNDEELDMLLHTVPEGAPTNDDCIDDGVLITYQRGQLDESRTRSVEAHLSTCADCRSLLAELSAPEDPAMYERAKAALLTPARRSRRGRWAAGGALAAAAAVLLFFPKAAEVPCYTLDGPFGGVKAERSAEAAATYYVPTSQIEWILRPDATLADSALEYAVYVQGADGKLDRTTAGTVTQAPGGAFVYTTEAQALLGEQAGLRTVHVVLARDALLPSADHIEALEAALGPHRRFTVKLDYRTSLIEED